MRHLEPMELARATVEACAERQAVDIVLLDLRGIASFTDYFVICSAESARQIGAIATGVERTLEQAGGRLHHREGKDSSGWVLLDCGDLIVHIFSQAQRAYYELEAAWSRARPIVRVP